MQISRFSNGGFVIHKIHYGNGKLSAWFDEHGNLLDVEKFNSIGRINNTGMESAKAQCIFLGSVYIRGEFKMLDFKLENDLVILRREFAAEYRSRRWGKLAALRKYSDSKKYFPPEYMPEFAYQSCIVLEHGYTIKFFGVV